MYHGVKIVLENILDGRELDLTGQEVEFGSISNHPLCPIYTGKGPERVLIEMVRAKPRESDKTRMVSRVRVDHFDWVKEGELVARTSNIRWVVVHELHDTESNMPTGPSAQIENQKWFREFWESIKASDRGAMVFRPNEATYLSREECDNSVCLLSERSWESKVYPSKKPTDGCDRGIIEAVLDGIVSLIAD